MPSSDSQGGPRKSLRIEPTVKLWTEELYALLYGKRAHVVEHLANAAEYTEDQLLRSSYEAESRQHLINALNDIVKVWNASPHDDPGFANLLFELLRKYTPPLGFSKLVGFLRLKIVHSDPSDARERFIDLRRKALHAMENYFPASPVLRDGSSPKDDDTAFTTYITLLRNLLGFPEHAAYGVKILFRIGVLPLDGNDFKNALLNNPSCIRGVLEYLLEEEHRIQAMSDLSWLYNVCLGLYSKVPAEQNFRYELESLGGKFFDTTNGPYIVVPYPGGNIDIEIYEEHLAVYAGLLERGTEEMFQRLLKTARRQ